MSEGKGEGKSLYDRDLEHLHQYEQFARMMNYIYLERERNIVEMHEAPTDQLQQLSGKILEADRILSDFKWEDLRARHAAHLNVPI